MKGPRVSLPNNTICGFNQVLEALVTFHALHFFQFALRNILQRDDVIFVPERVL